MKDKTIIHWAEKVISGNPRINPKPGNDPTDRFVWTFGFVPYYNTDIEDAVSIFSTNFPRAQIIEVE